MDSPLSSIHAADPVHVSGASKNSHQQNRTYFVNVPHLTGWWNLRMLGCLARQSCSIKSKAFPELGALIGRLPLLRGLAQGDRFARELYGVTKMRKNKTYPMLIECSSLPSACFSFVWLLSHSTQQTPPKIWWKNHTNCGSDSLTLTIGGWFAFLDEGLEIIIARLSGSKESLWKNWHAQRTSRPRLDVEDARDVRPRSRSRSWCSIIYEPPDHQPLSNTVYNPLRKIIGINNVFPRYSRVNFIFNWKKKIVQIFIMAQRRGKWPASFFVAPKNTITVSSMIFFINRLTFLPAESNSHRLTRLFRPQR